MFWNNFFLVLVEVELKGYREAWKVPFQGGLSWLTAMQK